MRCCYPDTKRKRRHFRARALLTSPQVLNLLFVRALADRLKNIPVIVVNEVDPRCHSRREFSNILNQLNDES